MWKVSRSGVIPEPTVTVRMREGNKLTFLRVEYLKCFLALFLCPEKIGTIMFSGLIDHCGGIASMQSSSSDMTLAIRSQFIDLVLGESIAVNGVCLTVCSMVDDLFTVNVSMETLRASNLAHVELNQCVNLERALRLSDRLGGHFVNGHVDETIRVKQRINHDEYIEFIFSDISDHALKFLVVKGSVAINGVSLTINALFESGFSVMCIPHTLELTQLSTLKPNDVVNIEYDYLAKLISKHFSQCQQES